MQSLAAWVIVLAALGTDPVITTAAGTGRAGGDGDGGLAVTASLNMPFDVALDAGGNVYLSDTFNHRIRRIDRATGMISSVAGNGKAGYSGDGGLAIEAQLNEPYGIVLDPRGNLFIADRLNRRVRRVDARSGVITTVAGNGRMEFSGDGGPAAQAGLVEPNGVALTPDGRFLYIADEAGHRVRKVDLATGRITTFTGTGRPRHDGDEGPAERASIWGARAVDVGPDGSVYILEREGNRLRVVSATANTIRTIAGTGSKGFSGDGGPANLATLNGPKELDVDSSGNIWIVDTENHAIRYVDSATLHIRTLAGNGQVGLGGDGGPPTSAQLDRPHGIAVAPDGSLWIADTNNHRLRLVTPLKD
jgi:DNA-binding beta-propeller fold protein YncE